MFALDELEMVLRDMEAQMAAWLGKVRAYDRSGEWSTDGFASAASALRHRCQLNVGVARGHVQLARTLERLPVVAEAFGHGEISRSHAIVVADACTPERAELIAQVEPHLVAAGREHNPHELTALVQRVTDAIDGDGGASSDDEKHQRRNYSLSKSLDGMFVGNGVFDPLDGLIQKTALEAEMARDLQPNDTRTTGQRRADAFTNLCRRSLDNGEVGESHGVRPHLTAVLDLNEQGASPDLIARARTERFDNGCLSAAMLEMIACDCNVSRVITAGKSEILDVGRATRVPSAAQWKALVERDRHCQYPGCDRPPSQCQAHHLWHWTDGGPTDIANMVLVCFGHHRRHHIEQARARARAPRTRAP